MSAELVSRLAELVPDLLEREFGKLDLCVLGTRMAREALTYFGVDSLPIPVALSALNAKAVEYMEDHATDEDDDTHEALTAMGGWIVTTDVWNLTGRFPGHLVLAVPGAGVLLDATAGQFARPDKSLLVPRGAVHSYNEDEFESNGLAVPLEQGGAMLYERLRDPIVDYRTVPDWRRAPATHRHAVGSLIRALKDPQPVGL